MGTVDYSLMPRLKTKLALEDEKKAEALATERHAQVTAQGHANTQAGEVKRLSEALYSAYCALGEGPPRTDAPPRTLQSRIKTAEEILWLALNPEPEETPPPRYA